MANETFVKCDIEVCVEYNSIQIYKWNNILPTNST